MVSRREQVYTRWPELGPFSNSCREGIFGAEAYLLKKPTPESTPSPLHHLENGPRVTLFPSFAASIPILERPEDRWLLLAESHLTRRLFGAMVLRIAALPVPDG